MPPCRWPAPSRRLRSCQQAVPGYRPAIRLPPETALQTPRQLLRLLVPAAPSSASFSLQILSHPQRHLLFRQRCPQTHLQALPPQSTPVLNRHRRLSQHRSSYSQGCPSGSRMWHTAALPHLIAPHFLPTPYLKSGAHPRTGRLHSPPSTAYPAGAPP